MSFGAWRSPASALQWGCKGRRFESDRPDQIKKPLNWRFIYLIADEFPGCSTIPNKFLGLLVDRIVQLICLLEFFQENWIYAQAAISGFIELDLPGLLIQ